MDGWIILDKPLGLGSTQGVAAVKRMLRTVGLPRAKVGHGGTLDPLATGVLPIAVGEATKLTGRMLDADKTYDFTIRFGTQTDTLDLEGAVVATSDVRPIPDAVTAVLARFTGPIRQAPPAYSAIKIDGERAYDRARAGEVVEMATREVTVHSLSLLPDRHPEPVSGSTAPQVPVSQERRMLKQVQHEDSEKIEQVTLTAHVSKGTYIRSLARDIALALGTVGHVTMLRRTKAGPFTLPQAISLDNLNAAATAPALAAMSLPITAGLDGIPALPVSRDQAGALRQGRKLSGISGVSGPALAMEGDLPVALVMVSEGDLRVVRGFNLMPKEDLS